MSVVIDGEKIEIREQIQVSGPVTTNLEVFSPDHDIADVHNQ